MPDEYWEDVNANRLTVGMPVCAVRAILARGSVPMGRDYSRISSFTGNHTATEGAYLMSGANRGLTRGGDEWSVRSGRFTSNKSARFTSGSGRMGSFRMGSLGSYSALWAQFENRSRSHPSRTYHRPAYTYPGGDY